MPMSSFATAPPKLPGRANSPARWVGLVALAAAGVALSVAVFLVARASDDQRVRGALELRAEWRAQDFHRKLIHATDSLEALAVFIETQDRLDGVAFHDFAQLILGHEDSVSSLVWAPLIKSADREAFVAALRRGGRADAEIVERTPDGSLVAAPQRDEYLPVQYEDFYRDQPSVDGSDQLSLPERRAAVERARDEGEPIATPPVEVFGFSWQAPGFVVFWPVYRTGAVPWTVAERRQAFRGMAISRFRFDQLLPALIADTPKIVESIDIFVDRGHDGEALQMVAHFDPASGAFAVGARAAPKIGDGLTVGRDFEVLGRKWTLVSHFSPALAADLRSNGPWAWLTLGLIVTGIVSAYLHRELWRRLGSEAVVAERTAALIAADQSLAREVEVRREADETVTRSRALIAATLEAAPFGIVCVSQDWRVLLWNRAAQEMFGYSAGEVLGKSHPHIKGKLRREGDQVIRRMLDGKLVRNMHSRRFRKDGTPIEIRFSGAPVYIEGQIAGFVGIHEDVTERAALERQLAQAQKMEAIGNLTGGLAHDFNNLLGIIIGNLDLLQPLLAANSEANELSGESLDAALRGADLTRRLLAFAQRQPLQPQRIDVNERVTDIVKLLKRVLGEHIEIALDLGAEIWPVAVDPSQLQAALVNLATNARDAMPNGGALTVATATGSLDEDYAREHPETVPGDYIMIVVSDTGTGMAPEVMSRIFEPFYTTKERGKGTGLGLSMVFGFMKQSGGHINVYSEVGVGTTFRLYLPRAAADEEVAETGAPEPPERGGGETVLAVEDDAALRRVVVRQLKEVGYRVIEAENGAQALDALETERADLLFSDVVMPGTIDGFELARRVMTRWPHMKVVLTSGFPETKINGNLGDLAASARLLSKPYRKDELARLLREVLAA